MLVRTGSLTFAVWILCLFLSKAQIMSQYGNKALSLAAVPSTLMLLPYLESLRNMQPGLHNFPMGQQSAVSSPPFAGLHPALTQLSPTFLGSSTPTSSASSNATKTSPPVTSMVTPTKIQIISWNFNLKKKCDNCRLRTGVYRWWKKCNRHTGGAWLPSSLNQRTATLHPHPLRLAKAPPLLPPPPRNTEQEREMGHLT